MSKLKSLQRRLPPGVGPGAGGILPLDINFTTLPDGALPAPLSGATWSISSGVLVNMPTIVGSNLLTDPGLEAAYTSGKCNTLTKGGSPTLTESADAHTGSKAQQFAAAAFNDRVNYPTVNAVAGAWYRFSQWVKRTAGTGTGTRIRAYQASLIPVGGATAEVTINTAAYTKKQVSFVTPSTGAIFCYPAVESSSSGFSTIVADDGVLERLTYADLFAVLPAVTANVTLKVTPAPCADSTLSALIGRANTPTSPDTFVMAYWHWRNVEDAIVVGLVQFVAGAPTALIAGAAKTEINNAQLELRMNGTTASLWYNNAQVGTDQTITPTDQYHGLLITGGNNAERFFAQAN